jgi:predicted PurR-regulated permease PerM
MAFNGAQMLVVLVTVFFGVIFTLMDPRPIIRSIFLIVPERHHDRTLIIMKRIGKFVPRWAGGTLVGMVAIGLLVFMFMWPIFEFMDALLLGLIAGFMASVPFLGPVLSAVPALLLAFGIGGMNPAVGFAGLHCCPGFGRPCDSTFSDGARHKIAPDRLDIFDAPLCGGLWRTRCSGCSPPGYHCGYSAR